MFPADHGLRPAALLLTLALLSGCLRGGFNARPGGDAGVEADTQIVHDAPLDGHPDIVADTGIDSMPDTSSDADLGGSDSIADGVTADTAGDGAVGDSAVADGGPDGSQQSFCEPSPSVTDIALYYFNGTALDETANHHDGLLMGGPQQKSGPTGCNQAFKYDATGTQFTRLPDTINLISSQIRSVSFSVKIAATHEARSGLFTADAEFNPINPGEQHMAIWHGCDGAIYLRVQTMTSEVYLCSEPVALGVWHRIGVNFGAPGLELWVDGVPATRTDEVFEPANPSGCAQFGVLCGTGTSFATPPSWSEPIVVGAGTHFSAFGMVTPVSPGGDATIDGVRIGLQRRNFATPP